jgi:RNA polymerase sigma factor (sigma-70 family)
LNSFISVKPASSDPMAQTQSLTLEEKRAAWPDTRLVRECLRGSEEAWSAFVDKYKNLIFSIPIKYGFSSDEATDIFQAVCLEMLTELHKLREPKALPKWIMQVTAHKCFHRKREMQRMDGSDPEEILKDQPVQARAEGILRQAQEEQSLRQAVGEMPPRCRQLVQMLFFEEPSRPYQEVAKTLGIAVGSIGFTRQRCLERLHRRLTELGF